MESATSTVTTCSHTALEILEREVMLLKTLIRQVSPEVTDYANTMIQSLLNDYFGEVVTPAQEHAAAIEEFNRFRQKENI